jgi:hypothetical protein
LQVQTPLSYPSQGKSGPEGWIASAGGSREGRINGIQDTHHDAGTSRPNVVEFAVDVPNVVLGRRHGLQTSNDVAVWIMELFERKGEKDVRGCCD